LGSVSKWSFLRNNNITAFASLNDARAAKVHDAEYFGSSQVDVCNSFAGIAPFTDLAQVKKFTNRKVAVERIWTAIQVLSANVAKPATHVAPAKSKQRRPARCFEGKGVAWLERSPAHVFATFR